MQKIAKAAILSGFSLLFVQSVGIAQSVGPNAQALSETMVPQYQYDRLIEEIIESGAYAAKVHIESRKIKADLKKVSSGLKQKLEQTFTHAYLVKLNAEQISKDFSEAELGEILAFYNSKTGKKWITRPAEVKAKSLGQLYKEFQSQLPKMISSIIESVQR